GVGMSFLVSQLVADSFGWRSAFFVTGVCPAAMIATCMLMRPHKPAPASSQLFAFGPVFRNRDALGYVLGYGAHCFELYGIRTWFVGFWSFVVARHGGQSLRGTVVVSFVFTVLAMPASIFGNEAAIRFGRHRAITSVMIASALIAIVIGLCVTASPWL